MVWVFLAILTAGLIALSVYDWREYRLPDALTFPLMGLGLLQVWVLGGNVWHAVIGLIAGYSVFVLIELAFKRLRGIDGLGRGDAKLLAAGGAWCGWAGLPLIVLLGSSLGLIALLFPSARAKMQSGYLPFGPFLALGIFCVWAAQQLAASPAGIPTIPQLG